MAQASTRPSQVMRRQFWHTDPVRAIPHNVPDRLFRHAVSPCPPHSSDPAKDSASGNSSRPQPLVQLPFHTVGIGTVRTCPALPTKSTIAQCSSRCCRSSILRPTASCRLSPHASSNARSARSRFSLRPWLSGACQREMSLLYRQPVSKANTQFLHSFSRGECQPGDPN